MNTPKHVACQKYLALENQQLKRKCRVGRKAAVNNFDRRRSSLMVWLQGPGCFTGLLATLPTEANQAAGWAERALELYSPQPSHQSAS